jgi:hypothetical protein
MSRSNESNIGLGLAFPVLAGATVLCLGYGASTLIGLHEQQDLWEQQAAELEQNPAVFAITRPEDRPAGELITSWTESRYDGTSEFVLSLGPDGFSLSDGYAPTSVVGPGSAIAVPCSTLNVKSIESRPFEYGNDSYRVIRTYIGNAAVCIED